MWKERFQYLFQYLFSAGLYYMYDVGQDAVFVYLGWMF